MTQTTAAPQTADVARILRLHAEGRSVRAIAAIRDIGVKRSRIHQIIQEADASDAPNADTPRRAKTRVPDGQTPDLARDAPNADTPSHVKTRVPDGDEAPAPTSVRQLAAASATGEFMYIAPGLIDDNPYQIRETRSPEGLEQLRESVAAIGVQNTPTARNVGTRFQIAQGHGRRDVVAELIAEGRWPHPGVPLDVRAFTDAEMALIAAAENSAREDVSRVQEIKGWRQMLEAVPEMTVQDLVPHVGLDRSTIQNYLALLRLPDQVLDLIDQDVLPRRAARELFALENEHKSRGDVMLRAIEYVKEDAKTYGEEAKYTGDTVRQAIKDVVGNEPGWRPIGPGTDYSANWFVNSRTEALFDVDAFAQDHPESVFELPDGEEGKGTRRWTDAAAEWDEAQKEATKAEKQPATKGKTPATKKAAPTPSSAASPAKPGRSEQYDQLVRSDPVVLAAMGRPDAWAGMAQKHVKAVKPRPPDSDVPGQVAYHRLHVRLIEIMTERILPLPAVVREEWARIEDRAQQIHDELGLSEFGLSYMQSRNATIRYVLDAIRNVDTAIAGGVKKALTREQREAAGTRAEPLLLGTRAAAFVKWLGRTGTEDLPHYFQEPQECRLTCTTGARYGQTYQGQPVELVCTNQECWTRKRDAGKSEYQTQVDADAQAAAAEDDALVAVLQNSMTPPVARSIGLALVASTAKYTQPWPNDDRDFAYEPANITRLKALLKLEDGEQGEDGHWHGAPMLSRASAGKALKDADGEVIQEAASRLIAHALRYDLADGSAFIQEAAQAIGAGKKGGR